jgi:hypothetical protein
LQECPTPPNPRVVNASSSIWSGGNEGIYQVPLEVEQNHKIFPTSASMLNHQCTVNPPGGYEDYTSTLLKPQQREKGQKSRQRHVSAIAGGSDKRPNNPSAAAIASTASEASIASGDLWRLQNKFPTQDFEQDLHPFQENLVGGLGLRSNSGNYKRLPQPQPQPQAVSRPNSQHIYVDLDSSNSSFSSASGAAEPETPQTGTTTQCHTPRSYVVSQC